MNLMNFLKRNTKKDSEEDSIQTIAILLDPAKLENPDLDLRYEIPETLENLTDKAVWSEGYDFISGYKGRRDDLLVVFLHTKNARKGSNTILDIFQKQKFMENDLCKSVELFIAETQTDDFFSFEKVYPIDR